ncbi:MAG: hypothetical protein ACTSQQ_03365 [Candidatus Helarchaeota archaeon]
MNGFVDPIIEPLLWFITSAVFLCILIYFIKKYFKINPEAKPFILGWILFIGGFTIARTIETIRRYYIGSYYDIIDSGFQINGLNLWLRLSYYIIAWSAITIFYFVLEKYIMKEGMKKNTRYVLTIFSALEGLFSATLYFTAATIWNLLIVASFFFIVAFFPIFFFIYLAKNAITKEQRYAWIFITVGFLLFILGVMADLPETSLVLSQYAGSTLPILLVHYGTPLLQMGGGVLVGTSFAIIYKEV